MNSDYDIDFVLNKNLNIYDIFDCKPQADGIYWELKAGQIVFTMTVTGHTSLLGTPLLTKLIFL